MARKIVKIAGVFVALYVAYFVYSYFFGSMYGGKEYQAKAFDSEAKYLLQQYHSQQAIVFGEKREYDRTLHTKSPFSDTKTAALAFIDDPFVKERCADCSITNSSYRIAAFRKDRTIRRIWAIDDKGSLVSIL